VEKFLYSGAKYTWVYDIRQMDTYTAEPLLPETSLVEVQNCYWKLKSYKSTGTDEIPAEVFKAGAEILYSEINRLTCFIWNKEELPQQ
jgi:hypothetical protein